MSREHAVSRQAGTDESEPGGRVPQSAPRQPPRHSHWPRMQTPRPEHMFWSAQVSMRCTAPERHALQHFAGATGTYCVAKVILLRTTGATLSEIRSRRVARGQRSSCCEQQGRAVRNQH